MPGRSYGDDLGDTAVDPSFSGANLVDMESEAASSLLNNAGSSFVDNATQKSGSGSEQAAPSAATQESSTRYLLANGNGTPRATQDTALHASMDHASSDHTNNSLNVSQEATAESTPPSAPGSTTPLQRPRRAAASAANERMTRRTAVQSTPTLSESPATLGSPPKKRRARSSIMLTPDSNSTEVTVSPLKTVLRGRKTATKAPQPTSRKKARLGRDSEPDSNISNLCALLRTGEQPVSSVVDGWVEVYKGNHVAGYLELVGFFIHSAGCKANITQAMATMSNAELIMQLTQNFDEDDNDYPLNKNDKEFKKFRADFIVFLQTLILTVKDTALKDDYLLPTLFGFLSELSDSQVRAFRHTSTLGLMKMMTSLVEVVVELQKIVTTDQHQLELERKKKRPNKDRIRVLAETYGEHKRQDDTLKERFEDAYKSVFCNRYRDAFSAIRELCMEELGLWMTTFPQRYLDDSYLKYLGWSLNDKEPSVRRKTLSAILPLLKKTDPDHLNRLQLFSNKFKNRFLEMVRDVDTECSLRAMKILVALNKLQRELFDKEDLDNIFHLVFVPDRHLATGAAEILLSHLNNFTEEDRLNGRTFKSGKEWKNATFDLLQITRFWVESQQVTPASHCAYLVDSLFDTCPAVKDWEAITDLLLEEFDGNSEAMTEKEEMGLVEILARSVKQSVSGEGPPLRGHATAGRRGKARDVTRQTTDEAVVVTEQLMDALPKLISKYKQDLRKLQFLISLPQYFDVDLYTTNHKETELEALMDLIAELFIKYAEPTFLKNVIKTFEALEKPGSGIVNQVQLTRNCTLETVSQRLNEALQHWIAGEDEEQLNYHVESSLRRLGALWLICDVSNEGNAEWWDLLMKVLERSAALHRDKITLSTIHCLDLFLMWRLRLIKSTVEDGVEPEVLKLHVQRIKVFCDLLIPLIADSPDISEELLNVAFTSLVDVLIIHQPAHVVPPVLQEDETPAPPPPVWHSELTYPLPVEQQATLAKLIDTQVFSARLQSDDSASVLSDTSSLQISKERRFLQVQKRRNLLIHFSRALTHGVLLPQYASTVFKNFVTSNADFGDIIKEAVKRLQEANPVYCAEAIAVTLVLMFSESMKKRHGVGRSSKEIADVKGVAKQFAGFFGNDKAAARPAMGALHKYCLEFIRDARDADDLKRRMIFFDVLGEFATKLLWPDKVRLLEFLSHADFRNKGLSSDALLTYQQYVNVLKLRGTADDQEVPRKGRRVDPSSAADTATRPRAGLNHREGAQDSRMSSVDNHFDINSTQNESLANQPNETVVVADYDDLNFTPNVSQHEPTFE